MEYNRTFLRKLKENYFMSKALYETVKEQAEEKALYHEAEQQLIDYAIEIIPDFFK